MEPAREDQHSQPLHATVERAADGDEHAMHLILEELRALPEVNPRPPPLWAPRSQQHRIGCVLRDMLDDAVRHATGEISLSAPK